MTEPQRTLLIRLRRRPIVFSGHETDDERLTMLQLYALRFVVQFTNARHREVMEWRITNPGRKALVHQGI